MTLVTTPRLEVDAALTEHATFVGARANESIRNGDYATAAAMVVSMANLSPACYRVDPSPFAISLARLAATGSMHVPRAETPLQ